MRKTARLLLFLLPALCAQASLQTTHALEVPLESDAWNILSYQKITPHKVSFLDNTMQISVQRSAGAIIYPLPTPAIYNRLSLRARIKGQIQLDGRRQGGSDADDFRLRIGVVYSGDKTLGFLKRSIAPGWIKTMYDLAPEGTGISRVEFYDTWQQVDLAGTSRLHPVTDLWREHFVLQVDSSGVIDQQVDIPTDQRILALWISSDGDDTGSAFEVSLEKLELIKQQ